MTNGLYFWQQFASANLQGYSTKSIMIICNSILLMHTDPDPYKCDCNMFLMNPDESQSIFTNFGH